MAKEIDWRGSSLNDLIKFPEDARISAGKELRKIQYGHDASDFKLINDWGMGVIEIRMMHKQEPFA
jgi:phage-related protein